MPTPDPVDGRAPVPETRPGVVTSNRRRVRQWMIDRSLRTVTSAAIIIALVIAVPHHGVSDGPMILVIAIAYVAIELALVARFIREWRKTAFVYQGHHPGSPHEGRWGERTETRSDPSLREWSGSISELGYNEVATDASRPLPDQVPRLPGPEPVSDDADPATYDVHPDALREALSHDDPDEPPLR